MQRRFKTDGDSRFGGGVQANKERSSGSMGRKRIEPSEGDYIDFEEIN